LAPWIGAGLRKSTAAPGARTCGGPN